MFSLSFNLSLSNLGLFNLAGYISGSLGVDTLNLVFSSSFKDGCHLFLLVENLFDCFK